MNKKIVLEGLKEYDPVQVKTYVDYLAYLESTLDNKTQKKKYPFMKYKTDDELISNFKKVAKEGLVFDGDHITLQSTGISYDYQAYKNKMLIAYPNSIVDDDLVYEKDTFSFKKESGKVYYTHDIIDPFSRTEDQIIGGYCVIKNKRGEFLTMLSAKDIEKHRKVAKTDYIWKSWFVEMARKTVIKKACKKHFQDIYQEIINTDNHENDIDSDIDIDLSLKQQVEEIHDLDALKTFYMDNKDKHTANAKGFNELISKRKQEIVDEDNQS